MFYIFELLTIVGALLYEAVVLCTGKIRGPQELLQACRDRGSGWTIPLSLGMGLISIGYIIMPILWLFSDHPYIQFGAIGIWAMTAFQYIFDDMVGGEHWWHQLNATVCMLCLSLIGFCLITTSGPSG